MAKLSNEFPELNEAVDTARLSHDVTVVNATGLHFRPAAVIVRAIGTFKSAITLEHCGVEADGRSIISIVSLRAVCGAVVRLNASGADAADALKTLAQLFTGGFGEEDTSQCTVAPSISPAV